MNYNPKYYVNGELTQAKAKRAQIGGEIVILPKKAIHTYTLSDGTLVGMFQGSRGRCPKLDFVVKILTVGKESKLEAPPHTYWVVDLLIKAQKYPTEVKEIVKFYSEFYEKCVPFKDVKDRQNYKPRTVDAISKSYEHVVVERTLPIDYVALIVELFCLCEKQNVSAETNVYMFKNILKLLSKYVDGEANYMDVLRNSVPQMRFNK